MSTIIQKYLVFEDNLQRGIDKAASGNSRIASKKDLQAGCYVLAEVDTEKYGTIILNRRFLKVGEEYFETSQCDSVRYHHYIHTVNLVPQTNTTTINLRYADGRDLKIVENRRFSSRGVHAGLEFIFQVIAKCSFDARMASFLANLQQDGRIALSPKVYLHADGVLNEEDAYSVELWRAKNRGTLFFDNATARRVEASEVPLTICSRLKRNPGTIKFVVTEQDYDIAHSVMLWMANKSFNSSLSHP